VSADIAIRGMRDGMFTGKKLGDYDFPDDLSSPPARHPRRIVNGSDGTDANVSQAHGEFAAALEDAGWAAPAAAVPDATGWIMIIRKAFKC